jgi:hypothetical protein
MSRRPDIEGVIAPLTVEQTEEIRELLERILASHLFRSSRRCHTLLRHIVEQTISGDTRALKERTLGLDVFGRPADYDTNQDPIVRSTAAEIRKKLAQYYQEPGHNSDARIELISGSYVASFHFEPRTPPQPVPQPPAPKTPRRRMAAIAALGCAAVAILTGGVLLLRSNPSHSDLDSFWKPLLDSPGPVLICLGQPITYNLKSTAAQDAIQAGEPGTPRVDPPEEGSIPRKDLVILGDRYVALSDAISMVGITSLLERRGKPYRIRGDRTASFADLRETAAVLIAAFDNQWALKVTGALRYTFVKDSQHSTDLIRDRLHPENNDWRLTGAWPYWDVPYDYAVISRVVHGPTDHAVIGAAGITEYGTLAAGEFLSQPAYFAEAVRRLPRGWENRNVQIVLGVPVISRVAGHAQVLATHVW